MKMGDNYDQGELFDNHGFQERRFVHEPMRPGWGFNYVRWWRDYKFTSRGWGSAIAT